MFIETAIYLNDLEEKKYLFAEILLKRILISKIVFVFSGDSVEMVPQISLKSAVNFLKSAVTASALAVAFNTSDAKVSVGMTTQ